MYAAMTKDERNAADGRFSAASEKVRPRQNKNHSEEDDEEDPLLAVLDKAGKPPPKLIVRITGQPGNVFGNLLVIVIKAVPENPPQPVGFHLLLVGDVMKTEGEHQGCQEVDVV